MKIALVLSLKESEWRSCQVIVPNLCRLYRASFPEAQFEDFDYSVGMSSYEYHNSLQGLIEFAPDKIIICDHKPFQGRLIEDLMREAGADIPPMYVHLFGDFSIYAPGWLDNEDYLQQMGIKFIAASRRQKSFVEQFILQGEGVVAVLPFPVDEEEYSFSPERRVAARKQLGWQGLEGKDFLYTGRLSAQKNITPLIHSFHDFIKMTGSRSRLHIAGSFDDLGYPFFGVHFPPEYNRHLFMEALESLDQSSIREQIHFVGNLSGHELLDYYQACDIFVSLSLHNDEDYGMAPAEALCCGMPLVLSDWGGYASFCLPEAPCSLVPVRMAGTFFQVDHYSFVKSLIKYDGSTVSEAERLELSLKGKQAFSLAGNRECLRAIHAEPLKPFSGWNDKFVQFADCFAQYQDNPFGVSPREGREQMAPSEEPRIESRKIYRECYAPYLGATSH